MTAQYIIGALADTYRSIKIYHAVSDTGKQGFRITSVISKRLFSTIEAAQKVIMEHDTKLGYGKIERG